MPVYEYRCPANGRVVEVSHDSADQVRNWGELCYLAQMLPGATDPAAPVERIFRSAPAAIVHESNSELRNQGFTKLVRRDKGVYENVTAVEGEARFMVKGQPDTVPHVHKKVED